MRETREIGKAANAQSFPILKTQSVSVILGWITRLDLRFELFYQNFIVYELVQPAASPIQADQSPVYRGSKVRTIIMIRHICQVHRIELDLQLAS